MELKKAQDKLQDTIKEKSKVQEKLKNAEEEINDSNANVNALVGQQQKREKEREEMESTMNKIKENHTSEMQSKQSEINRLNTQFKNEKTKVENLESNLKQVKDENTQVKNQLKEVKQNGVELKSQSHYEEFQVFKNQVTKDIEDLRKIAFEKEKLLEGSNVNVTEEKKGAKKKKKKKKKALSTHKEKQPGMSNENQNQMNEDVVSSNSSSEEEDGYESAVDDTLEQEEKERGVSKTLIISTSITRDIQPARFNAVYEYGRAWFVRKRGWKIKQIKEDVKVNMEQGDCDEVIIHMGGNDLQDMYKPEITTQCAVNIIETGRICKERGAKTVFIAGVTDRKYDYAQERCQALNAELKELCRLNNFIFIDNSNILAKEHLYDRVHLNDPGTDILADNYLYHLRRSFQGTWV